MSEFDPNLFNRLRELWRLREGALVDLKSKIYTVMGNNKDLAEFIRDMIAFANTARRRGEPAYILFGVNDEGELLSQGIKKQYTRAIFPDGWDDNDPAKFEDQQNQIGRDLHIQVLEYVRPAIDFDYLPGVIGEILVSYIKIFPERPSEPFEVKKALKDRSTSKEFLRKGQCWKREGESKYEVSEEGKAFLYRCTDVPYISRMRWGQHLDRMVSDFTDEEGSYLDLSVENTDVTLDQQISRFLASDNDLVLFIVGRPGAGKTRYLHRLIRNLAEIARQNLEATLDEQPQTFIPIFVNLAGYSVQGGKPFEKKIALSLDRYGIFGFNQAEDPERILADRNLRLALCLDAFDELHQTKRNIRAIGTFLEEFPNLKIIIASRHNAIPPLWFRDRLKVSIAPLQEPAIFSYLAADLEQPEFAYEFLRQFPELLEMAGVPLTLQLFREYWKQVEPLDKPSQGNGDADSHSAPISSPSLGSVTDWLFNHLLSRERDEKDYSRYRALETVRQTESLSKLALWMDGNTDYAYLEDAKRYLQVRDIRQLQDLGVVRVEEDCLRFFNELTQAYFAAIALRRALRRGRVKWATERVIGNHVFWKRCLQILSDITLTDIDPLLQQAAKLEV